MPARASTRAGSRAGREPGLTGWALSISTDHEEWQYRVCGGDVRLVVTPSPAPVNSSQGRDSHNLSDEPQQLIAPAQGIRSRR